TFVMKCSRLLRPGSRPSVKLLKTLIGICLLFVSQLVIPSSGSDYFLSAAPGAGEDVGTGRSEFQISTITFHVPLACFLKSSTYLPRSLTGLPLTSVIVSS